MAKNKDGNVEGQYSSYTEYLLEETDLREKNIEILLFARASAKMNQKEENCQSSYQQPINKRKHSIVTYVMFNLNQNLA